MFGLRNPGTVEGTTPDQGAGSAGWGPANCVGVVEAAVALPGGGLFYEVLVGDQSPDPAEGGALGAGSP